MRTSHTWFVGALVLMLAGSQGATAVAQPASYPGLVVVTVQHMNQGRIDHEATLLADGHVLITGGGWADSELFDPEFDFLRVHRQGGSGPSDDRDAAR